MFVFVTTAIMVIPPAFSFYTDICENIIDIQRTLLESDYDINVSLQDVIFLRKNICQNTNYKGQLLEDKQKVVKEFDNIFARLRQDIQDCENDVNEDYFWQFLFNLIRTNFATNFLPLILAGIIFSVRTNGLKSLLQVLCILLLWAILFVLITRSSCSEDHLRIWSLYSDTVRIIANTSEESFKHFNHSLQPIHNELINNKQEYIWGNWILKYLQLAVKECFKLIFVRIE